MKILKKLWLNVILTSSVSEPRINAGLNATLCLTFYHLSSIIRRKPLLISAFLYAK